MKRKENKGFTLIELLVVIAIIGILSSVVLASLNTARTKSRDAKRVSDIKQLQLALEFYFDANGSYPAASDLDISSMVADGYIATIPHDPVGTDVDYSYAAFGTGTACTGYHIGATLEDKDHSVLKSDVDAAAVTTGLCTGSTDFTGAVDATNGVYDLKP
ncbi:prepilin-type N-terminal cleavage/methylation domain-containing protein [bacterium]|jgi:prepilin-type N-terminal cleavage/methylation domain-containing protein|nr:prepilin-type N-terminal cleavage/methylation domain-containing protein [bacterium]MBT3729920.1 prepilin-type N-terminal cleavage/methylation domain-containing protein [bacterium]MBT4894886.1 prepilin-type N-terminal cleavage/methylation domain-containing protein [bacterium]